MAEPQLFNIKKSSLLKALLYGHLVNILIGAIVFILCHWVMGITATRSVIATVIATALVSLVVAVLGTQKIGVPLAAMHTELSELHQKIDTAGNELSKTNQNSEALFDNLPTGLLVFNRDATLTNFNSKAIDLLMLNTAEQSTDEDGDMVEPSAPSTDDVMKALQRFSIDGSPGNDIDILAWLKQAREQKIQDTKRWQMTVDNRGDTSVACDVIVRYNREESHDYELVIILVDRSEEYARQEKQMEFISLAAHELRGPITILRGLLDILQQEVSPGLDGEYQTLVSRMIVSSRQLAGYVDNILGVSKVDRDTLSVQASKNDWDTLLRQAATDLATQAEARHRKLVVSIDKDLPPVAVDSSPILHVINNLVDNAIKYSPENGTITISAKLNDGMIETQVTDEGIGMPANVIVNLFTKFYRSHRSKQIISGTGLGLYLSKVIVEAHGGNIWVRSTEGVGTTFGFTLPTYASITEGRPDKASESSDITRTRHGWIKNHALYRR